MSLSALLNDITSYHSDYPEEVSFKKRFVDLIENHDNCLIRSSLKGHITGSAWIVSPARTHVLLTHHRKLDKWLQLGGHSDGDSNILNVALKEAQEESGLTSVNPLSTRIFDIDIHTIPTRKNEPEHEHYDIRYVFEADRSEELTINHESKALKWVPIEQVGNLVTNSRSIMRMVEKTYKRPVTAKL